MGKQYQIVLLKGCPNVQSHQACRTVLVSPQFSDNNVDLIGGKKNHDIVYISPLMMNEVGVCLNIQSHLCFLLYELCSSPLPPCSTELFIFSY